MKKIKTQFQKDLPPIPVEMYGYQGEYGRSSAFIDCPVCGEKRILVYLWSLCGSGKKCPKCGSYFSTFGCFKNILWKGGSNAKKSGEHLKYRRDRKGGAE